MSRERGIRERAVCSGDGQSDTRVLFECEVLTGLEMNKMMAARGQLEWGMGSEFDSRRMKPRRRA